MRLVSLCPSNTELIEYLGFTHQLVGVDDFSDWPKEIRHLPRVGPDLFINMDQVQQLKPDLVIASLTVPGMEKNIEQLENRNIPHIVINPNSVTDIRDSIIQLAEVLDVKKRGEEIARRFDEKIQQYKELSATVEKKTLYWEWWPKPVFTPGRKNWLTDISDLAGGKNIFSDTDVVSLQTSWEDVYERNPEHICLAWVGVSQEKMKPELLKSRPNWDKLTAIKKDNIYVLEESLYCRPSPRIIEGLTKLASILHPNVFPKYDGQDPLLK